MEDKVILYQLNRDEILANLSSSTQGFKKISWMSVTVQDYRNGVVFIQRKRMSFVRREVSCYFTDFSDSNPQPSLIFKITRDFFHPGLYVDTDTFRKAGFYYEARFEGNTTMTFIKYQNISLQDLDGFRSYEKFTSNGNKNLTKMIDIGFNFDADEHYLDDVEYSPVYITFKVTLKSRSNPGFKKVYIFSMDENIRFGDGLDTGFVFEDSPNKMYRYNGAGLFEASLDTENQIIRRRLISERQMKLKINKPNLNDTKGPQTVTVNYVYMKDQDRVSNLSFQITYLENFEEFSVSHGPASETSYLTFHSPYPFQHYLRSLEVSGDFVDFEGTPKTKEEQTSLD